MNFQNLPDFASKLKNERQVNLHTYVQQTQSKPKVHFNVDLYNKLSGKIAATSNNDEYFSFGNKGPDFELQPISKKQKEGVNLFKDNNVRVKACPGAGKTAIILYTGLEYPKRKTLVLTYNKNLVTSTQEKIVSLGLEETLHIYSLHGFATSKYGTIIHNDALLHILANSDKTPHHYEKFDAIIVDELQDCNIVHINFINKILKDFEFNFEFNFEFTEVLKGTKDDIKESTKDDSIVNTNENTNENVKVNSEDFVEHHTYFESNELTLSKKPMMILGDAFQTIWTFLGANEKYINNPSFYFHRYFVDCELDVSHRITVQNANFINFVMTRDTEKYYKANEKNINTTSSCKNSQQDNLKLFTPEYIQSKTRIKAFKQGKKPKYYVCNVIPHNPNSPWKPIKDQDAILNIIKNYLLEYKEEDVFILTPSLKALYVKNLADNLSCSGYKLFVPSKDEVIKNSLIKGKIVISTFHQVKGLERKLVFVFGFDDSFFIKNTYSGICPNELYVAVTRPSEQLVLIQNYKNGPLPFLNMALLDQYADVIVLHKRGKNKIKKEEEDKRVKMRSVESLVEFQDHIKMALCLNYYYKEVLSVKEAQLNISFIIQQDDLVENVSGFYKTLILYYWKIKNVNEAIIQTNLHIKNKLGFSYKENQVTNYSFIDEEHLQKCCQIIENYSGLKSDDVSIYTTMQNNLFFTEIEIYSKDCNVYISFGHNMDKEIKIALDVFVENNFEKKFLIIDFCSGQIIKISSTGSKSIQLLELLIDRSKAEEKEEKKDKIELDLNA